MRRGHRIAVAVVASFVVLGFAALTAWANWGERSAEATLAAFFEARQEGDCERLLDLVSEASWSEGGRLGGEDFLERCADLVDDYQPELHEAVVLSEDPERAVVRMAVRLDDEEAGLAVATGPDPQEGFVVWDVGTRRITDSDEEPPRRLAYEEGHLVREGDDWKVDLDGRLLRFGRSAGETVWGFLEAYRDGRCEELIGYVSNAAWSEDGGVDREDFVDQCNTVAEARQALAADDESPADRDDLLAVEPPIAMPQVEVTHDQDHATAGMSWRDPAAGMPWPDHAVPAEEVSLVHEALEWRLTTPALDVVVLAALHTRLLDEALGLPLAPLSQEQWAVYPDMPSSYAVPFESFEGDDAAEHRHEASFVRGGVRTLDGHPEHRRVGLLLYEFTDAEGARAYADIFSDRVVEAATWYNDDLSPVPVPGVDNAVAILTECSSGEFRHAPESTNCSRANKATAVASQDRFMIAVEVVDFEGDEDPTADELLGDLFDVVEAQLERL